jgi:hypothetical protein
MPADYDPHIGAMIIIPMAAEAWGVWITILRPASIPNAFIRARPSPKAVSVVVEGPLSGPTQKIYVLCKGYAL